MFLSDLIEEMRDRREAAEERQRRAATVITKQLENSMMFNDSQYRPLPSGEEEMKKTDRPTTARTETARHEYHNAGGGATLHRIVAGSLTSNWFTYQQIATLKTPSGVLHACTDYFHGSLPTNAVFTISEIK